MAPAADARSGADDAPAERSPPRRAAVKPGAAAPDRTTAAGVVRRPRKGGVDTSKTAPRRIAATPTDVMPRRASTRGAGARAEVGAADSADVLSTLHRACVQVGAGAALRSLHESVPMLRPLLPADLRDGGGDRWDMRLLQQQLVRQLYAEHGLTPADWEIEGILAIAGPRGDWLPDVTRGSVQSLLSAWLPGGLVERVFRLVPLEPLLGSTLRAVAATWAVGTYTQVICKLRKQGQRWLPAPSTGLLRLTPARLRQWTVEALRLVLPPLRLATRWSRFFPDGKRR